MTQRKGLKRRTKAIYAKGGEVLDVPNTAPSEPDQRIDKMTGMPYDEQAGTAFTDEEDRQDPLQRMGFGKGGAIMNDPLQRLGFGHMNVADFFNWCVWVLEVIGDCDRGRVCVGKHYYIC